VICRCQEREPGGGVLAIGDRREQARRREWVGRLDTEGRGTEGVAARGRLAAGGGEGSQNSGELQSRAIKGRRRRKRKGVFPQNLCTNLKKNKGLDVKKNLTTVLELKQNWDQNESCTTFQTLQLCFRVWTPKLKYEVLF
jgi:hypothetical protein